MDVSEPPAIRGYVCRGFAQHLVHRWGRQWVDRAVAQLPDSLIADLDVSQSGLGFVPSSWYPAPKVHALLDVIFRDIPEHRWLELAGDAGRHVFAKQMRGLQRTFFSLVATPTRYLRHAPRTWAASFRTGQLKYETGPGFHRSTYCDWEEHHPLVCRAMMVGRLEAYSAMGLDDARLSIHHCDPARGCQSTVYWGERREGEPDEPDARA